MTSEGGKTAVLDVEGATRRTGLSPEDYRLAVRMGLVELGARIEALRRFHGQEADGSALADEAHGVTGVAANIGALALAQVSRELEGAFVQGGRATATRLLATLAERLEEARARCQTLFPD